MKNIQWITSTLAIRTLSIVKTPTVRITRAGRKALAMARPAQQMMAYIASQEQEEFSMAPRAPYMEGRKTDPEKVKVLPAVGSGQPTMRGILVKVIKGRFFSGESIDEIALDYGLLRVEVERALRYGYEGRS